MTVQIAYVPNLRVVKDLLERFSSFVTINFIDIDGQNETEGRDVIAVVIDGGRLLFSETELRSNVKKEPIIIRLQSSFYSWIHQFIENSQIKLLFEYYHVSSSSEFTVIESDNLVLSFLYYNKGGGSQTNDVSREFRVISDVLLEYQKYFQDPISYSSVLKRSSSKDRTQVQPSIQRRGTSATTTPTINFNDWNPTYGPILPTMHPYLLHNNQYYLITANTPKPIPFSNDFFEGYALFLVNSKLTTMDKIYEKRFQNDKNCFEVQLQGKFKQIPKGKLFVGAEITKKMELGLFTKGICHSILQFCQRFSSSLHHSFGDKQNIELPHITSPFWSTIDRLVVTPKGEKPPNMLQPFFEDLNQRKNRRSNSNYSVNIDLESIYSFSLKTSYMDLEKWTVVNIPLMKSMDLHTFWSDADIRFTAYSIDPSKNSSGVNSDGYPVLHKQTELDRVFALEIKHFSNHPEWSSTPKEAYDELNVSIPTVLTATELEHFTIWSSDALSNPVTREERNSNASSSNGELPASNAWKSFPADLSDDELDGKGTGENSDNEGESVTRERSIRRHSSELESRAEEDREEDEEEDDESLFFDAEEGRETFAIDYSFRASIQRDIESMKLKLNQNQSVEMRDEDLEQRFVSVDINGYNEGKSRLTTIEPIPLDLADDHSVTSTIPFAPTVFIQQKSLIDKTSLVLAVVEIDETRASRQGGRRVLYAFRQLHLTVNRKEKTKQLTISDDCILRSFNEWKSMFPLIKLQDQEKEKDGNSGGKNTGSAMTTKKKPFNYSKLIEEEQRRIQLDVSYKYLIQHYYYAVFNSPSSPSEANTSSKVGNSKANNNVMELVTQFTSDDNYNRLFLLNTFDNQVKNQAKIQRHSNKYGKLQSEIALRISNYYYSQEFIYYDEVNQQIIFKNSNKRLGNKLIISLKNIISIKVFPHNSSIGGISGGSKIGVYPTFKKYLPISIPNTVVMMISTFARQYLMLIHERDENLYSWLKLVPPTSSSSTGLLVKENTLASTSDAYTMNATELINDSNTIFTEKNERMILNHRVFTQFLNCKIAFSSSNPLQEFINNPVKYVSKLLEMILTIARLSTESDAVNPSTTNAGGSGVSEKEAALLANYEKIRQSNSNSNVPRPLSMTPSSSSPLSQMWIDFMDGVAYLQQMDVTYLFAPPAVATAQTASSNQKDLLCIFLNLYHTLLLHCYLIMGIPTNIFKWQSFFRNCCYEAFGEIFSLSELEHNVLRAGE